MDDEIISFKILILGDQSVGKTSFIIRYCDNIFYDEMISTIGIDVIKKSIEIHNKNIIIKIFDTAGQERFKSISKNYFKSSDGILLLYDVSNLESFNSIKGWINNIEESLNLSEIGFVVVANKVDIPEDERQVSDLMKKDLEKSLNIKIIEASAKDNKNVEECFMMLVNKIYENRYELDSKDNNKKKDNLVIKNNDKQNQKGCC